MDTVGFDELADLALRKSGQAFRVTQVYLMEARLAHILRRENFSTLDELAACLKARPNLVLENEIVAALTGKHTQFFQDRDTLARILSDVLPRRAEQCASDDKLRILCAGGGTGQEAYSLAMLLAEAGSEAFSGKRIEIVSIDLCKASTERARAGFFSHFEIQMGLSVHRMLAHFKGVDGGWQASEALRDRISFRVHNLLEDPAGLGVFDVILCRNVLPPMAATIAIDVVRRLSRQLTVDGLFFLADEEIMPVGLSELEPSYDARGAYCRRKAPVNSAEVA